MARMSLVEHTSEEASEEKKKLKLQLDTDFKILEEAEYMDEIIEERQKDIDQIGKIMGDVREIAKDFWLEVNMQGDKIVEIDRKNEATAANTIEASRQLQQANKRSRSNGWCLLLIALVILVILGGLIAVLFGTKVIG